MCQFLWCSAIFYIELEIFILNTYSMYFIYLFNIYFCLVMHYSKFFKSYNVSKSNSVIDLILDFAISDIEFLNLEFSINF